MGDDLLRPAFGNTELGKFADNVEETLPTLAPVLDLVFGVRPEPKKGHDAAWWAEQRPRPYRGPTADPSGPAKERAAYMIKFEEEKRRLAKEAREGKRAAQAAAQMAAEASRATFETKAKVEAELNRIGFFGRPVQKQRLLKRERQLERNDREEQAMIFKHLLEDSLAEIDFQNKRIREQSHVKAKAVASAAHFRAQERGALAAATGLKVGGNQLASAKEKAKTAAEEFCARAEEQENIAREAADNLEDAEEILTQEEEKVRACQSQISLNRSEARTLIDDCFNIECREISDLIEEELLLEKFVEDTSTREKTVAKGGPAWLEIQKQLKQLKHRLAVVAMEKRMFVPYFTKQSGEEAFAYKIIPSEAKSSKIQFELLQRPQKKEFMWVLGKQKPGMVALGKGLVGNLSARHKIVRRRDEGEYADDSVIGELPEMALSDLYKASDESGMRNAADPIEVRGDYLGQGGIGLFLSRKMFEAGETEAATVLEKDLFEKLWSQDARHEVEGSMLATSLKLRYAPPVIWTAGFVNGSKDKPNKFLMSKSTMGGLKKKSVSLTLGPQRKPFENVIVPGMHEDDTPEGILGADNQPRLVGTVFKYLKTHGEEVKEEEVIALVEVENVRDMVGMKRSLYIPPENNPKHFAKYKLDPGGDVYRKKADDTNEDRYLLQVTAPAKGVLTGLFPEVGSKIESFFVLAWVDIGDKDWDKSLLPVSEWVPA